jgi:hypothetical protein
MIVCAALVAAGGVAGAIGIINPRRLVRAAECPGGQLVAVPGPAAEFPPPTITTGQARVVRGGGADHLDLP